MLLDMLLSNWAKYIHLFSMSRLLTQLFVCRNYFRCSDNNCGVKKTVEREARDKGIVITSYLGKHNNESPSVIYYTLDPEILVQLPRQTTGSPIFSSMNYVPGCSEQHQ